MTIFRSIRWQILIVVSCLLPLLATSVAAAPLQPDVDQPIIPDDAGKRPSRLTTPQPVVDAPANLKTWQVAGGFIYYCTESSIASLRRRPVWSFSTTTLNVPCSALDHFTADESGVYYRNKTNNRIEAVYANDPTGQPTNLAPVSDSIITNLGLDGFYVYWIESVQASGGDVNPTFDHTLRRVLKTGGSPTTVTTYEGLQIMQPNSLGLIGNNVWWVAYDGLYRVRKPTLLCPQQQCPVTHVAPLNVTDGQLTVADNDDILWWGDVVQPDSSAKQQLLRTRCAPNCQTFVKHDATNGTTIFAAAEENPPVSGYVVENNRLLRINLDGSPTTPETVAENISELPAVLAIDNGYVYFTFSDRIIARLPLDATAIDRDILAYGWEVTQGIQNMLNDVDLVAGKTTYVRLFPTLPVGEDAPAVEAILHGYDQNGIELAGSPLYPLNTTIPVKNGDPDRGANDSGWLFRLPSTWTTSAGETIPQQDVPLTLRGEIDPRGISTDNNTANNILEESFVFKAKAPMCLTMHPVWTEMPYLSTRSIEVGLTLDFTAALLPTPHIIGIPKYDRLEETNWCWKYGVYGPWCSSPYEFGDDAEDVLDDLAALDFWEDRPEVCTTNKARTLHAGIVHANAEWKDATGVTYRNTDYLVSKVPRYRDIDTPLRKTPLIATMAHEIGHDYGRRHVQCPLPPSDPADEDYSPNKPGFYPYDTTTLDDRAWDNPITHFGFDTIDSEPLDPEDHRDVMSYCGPQWISDYSWTEIYGRTSDLQTGSNSLLGMPSTDTIALASGHVNVGSNTGTINVVWTHPTAGVSAERQQQWAVAIAAGQNLASDYHLQLIGSTGQLLHDQPIEVRELTDAEDNLNHTFNVVFTAPNEPVQHIRLMHKDQILDTRSPGSNVPDIQITAPSGGENVDDSVTLVWSAQDADSNDRLLYTIQYSPDNGLHWYPLRVNYGGDSDSIEQRLTLNLRAEAGTAGASALLRVLASDGYNTKIATSAPFSVARRAPEVVITNPTPNQWYRANEVVTLRAQAFDAEDSLITDDKLRWSGSGIVGNGPQVEVWGLAPGSHEVLLQAIDDDGEQSTAQTSFNIAPLNVPAVDEAGMQLDGFCDDSHYAQAETVPLTPYSDGAQATAHLVHTAGDLWVCLMGLEIGSGYAGVVIDVDNSGDEIVKEGDLGYFVWHDGTPLALIGDNAGGFVTDSPSWVTTRVSETGSAWNAELRIRGNRFDGWDTRVGMAAIHRAEPGGTLWSWPYTADRDTPRSWAQVNLGVAPQLNSIDPTTFTAGAGTMMITTTGTNFDDQSQLVWAGSPLPTTFINATTLQATVTAGLLSQAGEIEVFVRQSDSPALQSPPRRVFVVTPQPALGSISPNTAEAGQSELMLTVNGSNFVAGATVWWNGEPQPTDFIDGTRLKATIGANSLIAGRSVSVRVFNPEPTGGVSEALPFTINAAEAPPSKQIYLPLVVK